MYYQPTHLEEEPQSNNSHKTPGRHNKATVSLFLTKMIAKRERTQSNAQQKWNNHKSPQLEQQPTTNQEQQN